MCYIYFTSFNLDKYLLLLCFTFCTTQMLHFLQIEGKTFHWQKDGNLLYCDTHFIAVAWNQTHNIPEAGLH